MDPSIISMEPRPRRAAIALRRCSSDPCQNNHRAFRDASALSSNARSRCILVGSSRSRQDRAFAVCGSPSPLRLPCQAMRALPPSAGVEEPRPAARPLVRPRTASGLMRLRRHYSLSRNSIRGLEAALVAQTMDPAVEATTDTTSVPSGVFEIEERLRQAAVNLRTATENPTRQLVPPGFAWPACQVNVVEPTVPTCTTAPPPAEAIASSDASVCESVKGLPPTHSGTCVVCLAGPVEVLGASWLHPDEAMEGMVTNPTACQVSGCLECLKTYFEGIVNSGFDGACPRMRCMSCPRVVCEQAWGPLVDTAILKTFRERAETLLSLQCGTCHERGDIMVTPPANQCYRSAVDALIASLKKHIDEPLEPAHSAVKGASEVEIAEFRGALERYARGQDVDVVRFFDHMARIVALGDAEDTQARIAGVLRCVQDSERRASLHIRCLRFHPMVKTVCCDSVHCFRCRIAGGHPTITCEQYNASRGAGRCSAVPGLRGTCRQGRRHITCVCGTSFDWGGLLQERDAQAAELFRAAHPDNAGRAAAEILRRGAPDTPPRVDEDIIDEVFIGDNVEELVEPEIAELDEEGDEDSSLDGLQLNIFGNDDNEEEHVECVLGNVGEEDENVEEQPVQEEGEEVAPPQGERMSETRTALDDEDDEDSSLDGLQLNFFGNDDSEEEGGYIEGVLGNVDVEDESVEEQPVQEEGEEVAQPQGERMSETPRRLAVEDSAGGGGGLAMHPSPAPRGNEDEPEQEDNEDVRDVHATDGPCFLVRPCSPTLDLVTSEQDPEPEPEPEPEAEPLPAHMPVALDAEEDFRLAGLFARTFPLQLGQGRATLYGEETPHFTVERATFEVHRPPLVCEERGGQRAGPTAHGRAGDRAMRLGGCRRGGGGGRGGRGGRGFLRDDWGDLSFDTVEETWESMAARDWLAFNPDAVTSMRARDQAARSALVDALYGEREVVAFIAAENGRMALHHARARRAVNGSAAPTMLAPTPDGVVEGDALFPNLQTTAPQLAQIQSSPGSLLMPEVLWGEGSSLPTGRGRSLPPLDSVSRVSSVFTMFGSLPMHEYTTSWLILHESRQADIRQAMLGEEKRHAKAWIALWGKRQQEESISSGVRSTDAFAGDNENSKEYGAEEERAARRCVFLEAFPEQACREQIPMMTAFVRLYPAAIVRAREEATEQRALAWERMHCGIGKNFSKSSFFETAFAAYIAYLATSVHTEKNQGGVAVAGDRSLEKRRMQRNAEAWEQHNRCRLHARRFAVAHGVGAGAAAALALVAVPMVAERTSAMCACGLDTVVSDAASWVSYNSEDFEQAVEELECRLAAGRLAVLEKCKCGIDHEVLCPIAARHILGIDLSSCTCVDAVTNEETDDRISLFG